MPLLARVPPTSDFDCWTQIFVLNEYKPVVDLVTDRSTKLKILDIGANVGYASAYFKQELPNADITAVELCRDNYDLMQKNVQGIATPIWGGVWSKDCMLSVKNDFGDRREWSFYAEEDEKGTILGFPISKIMLGHVDILKIDIEGGEVELFKDDSFLKFVHIIAIEIHDQFKCRPQILSSLMKHKFQFQNYGDITVGIKE